MPILAVEQMEQKTTGQESEYDVPFDLFAANNTDPQYVESFQLRPDLLLRIDVHVQLGNNGTVSTESLASSLTSFLI